MNLCLMTALLCWSSVSGSEFHAVEVQPGEEVTLLCSNFTSFPSNVFWFKLADRLNISCISSMVSSDGTTTYYDGFQNSRFSMTSSMTTLFLRIKHVDLSDSGLYFCGSRSDQKPVIVSATFLKVQESAHGTTSWLLGAAAAFIIVVTCVAVTTVKLQTAANEEQDLQRRKTLDSDELKDDAPSLYLSAVRSRRPVSEREVEALVVYAASRQTRGAH